MSTARALSAESDAAASILAVARRESTGVTALAVIISVTGVVLFAVLVSRGAEPAIGGIAVLLFGFGLLRLASWLRRRVGAAAAAVQAGDPRDLYLTVSVRIGLLRKDRAEVRLSFGPGQAPVARGYTRQYWPRFRSVSDAPARVYGRLEPGAVLVVDAGAHSAILRASAAAD